MRESFDCVGFHEAKERSITKIDYKESTMCNIFWRSEYARLGQGSLKVFLGLASFVLLLAAALPGVAQQITGSFKGTVKDEQGSVITNATVKATNTDTGFTRSAVTDGDGAYNIQYLP